MGKLHEDYEEGILNCFQESLLWRERVPKSMMPALVVSVISHSKSGAFRRLSVCLTPPFFLMLVRRGLTRVLQRKPYDVTMILIKLSELLYFCSSFVVLVFIAGYIGSVSFLDTILKVVEKLRSVNPGLIYGMYPWSLGYKWVTYSEKNILLNIQFS